MPDKPLWLDRLPDAIRQLQQNAEAWVDRPTLEQLLGIGRRRAQQLLAPVATRRVGTSVVADRTAVIEHLTRIAAREEFHYDERRRQQLWTHLSEARRDWMERPPVLVEVPNAQVRRVEVHDFDGLPAGVDLGPGRITVEFGSPDEALQKLMALARAISRNREAFDGLVRVIERGPGVERDTGGSQREGT